MHQSARKAFNCGVSSGNMRNDVPVALFGAIAGFMNQNRRKRMNAAVNILFHIAQIY